MRASRLSTVIALDVGLSRERLDAHLREQRPSVCGEIMNGRGEVLNAKERRIVIGVLASFAAFAAWLNGFNPTHMSFVCQEDGFVEYSQAFLYLFAGALFAYVGAHKGFRNIWYWGYAFLFLLVCGEEVSWGQRIFNEVTPPGFAAVRRPPSTTSTASTSTIICMRCWCAR